MHPNLVLCRSQTPLGTLSLPPHLSCTFFLLLSSLFILIRTQPHPPPHPPHTGFLPPPSLPHLHQTGNGTGSGSYLLPPSIGVCYLALVRRSLMHLHNHEGGTGTLVSPFFFSFHEGERKYQRIIKKKRWDLIVSEEVFLKFETSSRHLPKQAASRSKEEEFQHFHFWNLSAPQTSPARHYEPTMPLLLTLHQNKAPLVAGHGCGHLEWMMSSAASSVMEAPTSTLSISELSITERHLSNINLSLNHRLWERW